MSNLRDEINEMLNTFDAFGISKEKQRSIITLGVYFNFSLDPTWNIEDYRFDCFKYARFLKFCKENGVEIDANGLVYGDSYSEVVKELVYLFDKADTANRARTKK